MCATLELGGASERVSRLCVGHAVVSTSTLMVGVRAFPAKRFSAKTLLYTTVHLERSPRPLSLPLTLSLCSRTCAPTDYARSSLSSSLAKALALATLTMPRCFDAFLALGGSF